MTAPFGEQIGVRLVEPGVVELDCRDDILQASGTIQGGAAALLVELSAESTGTVVPTDLELHYLSAVGAGPVRAVATAGNERGVQVDVHDLGHGSGSPRMVFLGFVHGVARSDGVR
jgi:acyl-coenzyme A thioesterase PaaI-like protein